MQENFNFEANSQRGSLNMFKANSGTAGSDGHDQFVLDTPPDELPREDVQDTAHWVQKLSEINVKLFQHMLSIPPVEAPCVNVVVFPDKQFAVSSCLLFENRWLGG